MGNSMGNSMENQREALIHKLLNSYKASYNIKMAEDESGILKAELEYYEHSEKYVLSRKAELWSADCEEFLFLYDIDELTTNIFEEAKKSSLEMGEAKMNIGPGHMSTYITTVIVCDSIEPEAKKKLKKSSYYKSFKFGFHGWLNYRVVAICTDDGSFIFNNEGKVVADATRKVI